MRRGRLLLSVLAAILAIAATGFAVGCAKKPAPDARSQSKAKYQCAMHPRVVSDKPGQCPICRMDLTPVGQATAAAKAAATDSSGRRVLYWYDPMAPGSKFDKPGKSPFMDMDLVPKYADETEAAGGEASASSVTLSPEAIRATGVTVAPVLRETLSRTIRTVGSIEIDETRQARVAARVAGRIEKLYADFTGQAVQAGAPLYALYSPELVATQREYLLALENRQRLAGGTPDTIQSADEIVAAARDRLRLWGIGPGQIAALEKDRSPRMSVTFPSPMTGTVLQKMAIEGQYVAEGTELYQLADLSSVWLMAQVYEHELGGLRVGQAAEVTISALPGRTYRGQVAFIEPVLDRETRSGRVRITLPNPRRELKPGMFADARLEIPSTPALTVPKSAVIDTGARRVVYVETAPNTFAARDVRVGDASGDRVSVLEGLKEGERVVATASFFVDSQAQLSGGSSIQYSGALDVKATPGVRP